MTVAAPTSPAVPVETVTPIKPSEAIRLGCLLAPVQAFTRAFEGDDLACAVGAMALGLGYDGPREYGMGDALPFLWTAHPALLTTRLPCPAGICDSDGDRASSRVWHLNDTHRWTREAIADWLEGLGL